MYDCNRLDYHKAWNLCRVCDIAVRLKTIMFGRILKKSLSSLVRPGAPRRALSLQRSRFLGILNVPPEGTPPVSTRLRPCWTIFLSILHIEYFFHNCEIRKNGSLSGRSLLPTIAPVARSIVVWTEDVRAIKKWRSVDPGASQGKAESHRGITCRGEEPLARRRIVVPVDVEAQHSWTLGGRADLLRD
jgi:hypothetical protein